MEQDTNGIIKEFRVFLNDMAGAHFWATKGLPSALKDIEKLSSLPRNPSNPDPRLYIGTIDPNDSMGYHAWRLSEFPEKLGNDGDVAVWIGQQWLVSVDAGWEDNYRGKIAQSLNATKNDLQSDYFSDLRKMRNDILKHKGIATKNNTGKCKSLKWAEIDAPIIIRMSHIEEFMHHWTFVFAPK